jgi:hypothetical protein
MKGKEAKMIKRLSTILSALWHLVEVCLLKKRPSSRPFSWMAWIGQITSPHGPNIKEKLLVAIFMVDQERLFSNRAAHISSGQVKQREQATVGFFR